MPQGEKNEKNKGKGQEKVLDKKILDKFSAEELLQELKAREIEDFSNAKRNKSLAEFETSVLAEVLRDKEKVIYGVDDRKDLFEVTDPTILNDADSVVVLIDRSQIIDNGNGTSTITGTKFSALKNLCSSEKFRDQLCSGFCSGFLVAPNIVATAGHCVDASNFPLADTRFVFGFRMTNATTAQTVINNTEIYRGTAVIDSQNTSNGADWALVRLDRSVTNHRVVTIRRTGKIADSQRVHVIGHPVGLPTKFADGAVVRRNTDNAFFVANLDTYGGNSGSPVFNSDNHQVEGILVRGETDFVQSGTCKVSKVCPTSGCTGESVNRTTEFSGQVP